MPSADDKIIILLDLIIPRSEVTKEVLSQVVRMKLYFEQIELMKKIDLNGVLLDEIYESLNNALYAAWYRIDMHSGSENFKCHFSRLGPQGEDSYWSVDNDLSAIRSDYLPWKQLED